MLEPRRIETNIKPQTIEFLGNGTYYYNYDITFRIVTVPNMDSEGSIEEERWDYIQVHLAGTPNYTDCARAIIREFIDESSEFSLINDYNAYQLKLLKDQTVYNKYVDYINKVSEIKGKVKQDFNN